MILLIDNYDSFTYNLAHLFAELGAEVCVRRNDELDAAEAERLGPSHLIVSPGPGRPVDSGATLEIVRRLAPRVPTLGVCLGHQAIVEAFGGEIGAARDDRPRQGRGREPRRIGNLPRPARRGSRRVATTRSQRRACPRSSTSRRRARTVR